MRLALFFTFITIIQTTATVFSQNVSLNVKDQSMREVLKKIETLSDYRFFYNDQLSGLNNSVTLRVENKSVKDVLDELLTSRQLTYRLLENNMIVIAPNEIAQLQKVIGKVTDATTKEPLIGVSIQVEGTNTGVVTDKDGRYAIDLPNSNSVLIFSFIGYITERVEISGKTSVDVILVPDVKKLDEIVVIGYGSQKQKDLTGAIATVRSDDIKKVPVTTMAQSLQGLAPGVQVTASDGRPGADFNVKIRGVGTFGDNTPLYVVDGYPVDGSPNYINPNDIASMSILKDASAIAIYGSRASNGVVIITTKRGLEDKTEVEFSAIFGQQLAPKKFKLMNATQFAQTAVQVANAQTVPVAYPAGWNNPSSLRNIDWQDEIFRNAMKETYSLTIRGGSDKTKAALSLAYLNQDGVVLGSSYKRYNVGFNIDHKIGSRIVVSSNIKYAFHKQITKFSTGVTQIGQIINNIPFMDGNPLTNQVKDGNGNYGFYMSGQPELTSKNFIAQIDENDLDNGYNDLLGNLSAEIELIKGLKFKSNFGVNASASSWWTFFPQMNRGDNDTRVSAQYNQGATTNNEWLWENTISYNKTFGANAIDIVLGMSAQENKYRDVTAQGTGYVNNSIRSLLGAQVAINDGYSDQQSMASTFGRLSYRLKERYLLTGTVRRDGSSKFAPGYQYGTFPSIGLGWVASEESFLKGNNLVDNLKIRGSWGQAGNQRIAPYQYLVNWYTGTIQQNQGYTLGTDQHRVTGLAPQNLAQKDLTWETTDQTNVGFDASFFKKLTLSLDYYVKKSKNFLLDIPLSAQTGFTDANKNAGSIQNKGIEVTMGYSSNIGEFKWSVNANLTTVKNKVLSLAPGLNNIVNTAGFSNTADLQGNVPSNRLGFITFGNYQWVSFGRSIVGGEVGEFYGWKTDGLFQQQSEINALNAAATAAKGTTTYYQTSATQAGDRKFQDVNHDRVINDDDRVVLGSPIPKCYGGITLNGSYKNFDFSIFVSGVYGNKILNYQKINLYNIGDAGRSTVFANASIDWMNNHWTGPGTSNSIPRAFIEDNNGNNRISDFFVEDGSFMRLKNLQIGYILPIQVSKKVAMKSLRVYVSGQNLLTLTGYSGRDPEIGDFNGVRNTGVDAGAYPIAKTFTLGLNATF